MDEGIELELDETPPPPPPAAAEDAVLFAAGRQHYTADDKASAFAQDFECCMDEPWSSDDSSRRIGKKRKLVAVVSFAILFLILGLVIAFTLPEKNYDNATVDSDAALSRFFPGPDSDDAAAPAGDADEQEVGAESEAADLEAERVERHFGTDPGWRGDGWTGSGPPSSKFGKGGGSGAKPSPVWADPHDWDAPRGEFARPWAAPDRGAPDGWGGSPAWGAGPKEPSVIGLPPAWGANDWMGDGWMWDPCKSSSSSKSSKSKSSKSSKGSSKSSKGSSKSSKCDGWSGDGWDGPHSAVWNGPYDHGWNGPHGDSWNGPHGDSWNGPHGDSWNRPHDDGWTGPHRPYPFTSSSSSGGPIEGWMDDGWDGHGYHQADIAHVRSVVAGLIKENRDLLPKFLRLGFHDCVGGLCDGCVDLADPDNRGLDMAMDGIYPTVQRFANKYSRADIWALGTLVAADMAAIRDRPKGLTFPMRFIGRKDCEGADARGNGGPVVPMPGADLTTHDLFKFFYDDFGFDEFESTVIMGAHSAAVAHRENIGFGNLGRDDGWVFDADSYILSNRYYTPQLTDRLMWHVEFLDNSQFEGVPNRYQWYIDPSGFGPIMLNVDIALVRNLDGFLVTDKNGVEGLAVCLFHETEEFDEELEEISGIEMSSFEVCPNAKTLGLVDELGEDNAMFLLAFENVLAKMIVNGYMY